MVSIPIFKGVERGDIRATGGLDGLAADGLRVTTCMARRFHDVPCTDRLDARALSRSTLSDVALERTRTHGSAFHDVPCVFQDDAQALFRSSVPSPRMVALRFVGKLAHCIALSAHIAYAIVYGLEGRGGSYSLMPSSRFSPAFSCFVFAHSHHLNITPAHYLVILLLIKIHHHIPRQIPA